MFGKNLKYYRLRSHLSMKELAERIGVSPMAISNYESGKRMPEIQIIRKLTKALNVKLVDFMAVRDGKHTYAHCEFRKNCSLPQNEQELIRESVEEYFDRFYVVVDALGGEVLPSFPETHCVPISDDVEETATALRLHLGFAQTGPIINLLGNLENRGMLIYQCPLDNDSFSGMNGTVDGRPYIIINTAMTTERQRSTLVHELAHIFCRFPDDMSEKEQEKLATAIGGAFLCPKADMLRELGLKRTRVSADMIMVAEEYGVSMMMLSKRAEILGIISELVYRDFMIQASQRGWRKKEPSRISPETSVLFEQMVIHAIGEDDISVQRGAELLHLTWDEMNSKVQLQEAE